MEKTNPKVSVLMPSLNVSSYIRKCLDSVVNQTLKEIEILCIDAGSTDGTLEILRKYAKEDARIHVIVSDRKSYGYQMNLGLNAASGEYIGIVETDDWAEPDMFEKLYTCAKENDLDMAKSSYYLYWSTPEEKNTIYDYTTKATKGRTFQPICDPDISPLDQVELFTKDHSIWSAIYRRSFLNGKAIRFTETPGAAFQDTAFSMKVWCTAERVRVLEDCFLHYRQDNASSSIHSSKNMYSICEEYDEVRNYLNRHAIANPDILGLISRVQYSGYIWNFYRFRHNDQAQRSFLERFYQDFRSLSDKGELLPCYFSTEQWQDVSLLLYNPSAFYEKLLCDYYRIRYYPKSRKQESRSPADSAKISLSKFQLTLIRIRACIPYVVRHVRSSLHKPSSNKR